MIHGSRETEVPRWKGTGGSGGAASVVAGMEDIFTRSQTRKQRSRLDPGKDITFKSQPQTIFFCWSGLIS